MQRNARALSIPFPLKWKMLFEMHRHSVCICVCLFVFVCMCVCAYVQYLGIGSCCARARIFSTIFISYPNHMRRTAPHTQMMIGTNSPISSPSSLFHSFRHVRKHPLQLPIPKLCAIVPCKKNGLLTVQNINALIYDIKEN